MLQPVHHQTADFPERLCWLLSLILHEAYTSEFFHYAFDFYHKGRFLKIDGALDGLGVVRSLDDFDALVNS
jgi:hypothetical protein